MQAHLSRNKLGELGQLLAPSASWGHTAKTRFLVKRHLPHRGRWARLHPIFQVLSAPWHPLSESQRRSRLPCISGLHLSHLGSWTIREMEARRLAVAAAGQGVVGLRSLWGGRGFTKRLARKASG